jgi:nucleolar protein 12
LNNNGQDTNSVEAALLFHGKKFPPMLPRVLRVTRAKAVRKTASASQRSQLSNRPLVNGSGSRNQGHIYEPKVSTQQLSLQGRAAKLLGRAGAANIKGNEGLDRKRHPKGLKNIARSPETIVFEGFRASAKSRKPDGLKLSGKGKKSKLKKGRSIKRANDWKKSGRRSTK